MARYHSRLIIYRILHLHQLLPVGVDMATTAAAMGMPTPLEVQHCQNLRYNRGSNNNMTCLIRLAVFLVFPVEPEAYNRYGVHGSFAVLNATFTISMLHLTVCVSRVAPEVLKVYGSFLASYWCWWAVLRQLPAGTHHAVCLFCSQRPCKHHAWNRLLSYVCAACTVVHSSAVRNFALL
jgi:hypothetical protein